MAWTAFEHLRISGFAAPHDPAIVGIDRELAAALACGFAVFGLFIGRLRGGVAVSIVLGTAYMLSRRWLHGGLDYDALTYVPVAVAALYICWPRLIEVRS